MNAYTFRSWQLRSDGTLSRNNIQSRPYRTVEEVLAEPLLRSHRFVVHNFVTNEWYQVREGALVSISEPERNF